MSHSPLAFIYALFKPNIVINGRLERRPWGVHTYTLPAGKYLLELSYPWMFSSECGKNSVEVVLRPGDRKHIRYHARMIRYWPGKITVEDSLPIARALPPGRR